MKMNPLGRTGQMISELCLGTMTYSTQTPQADAHRQIDMSLDAGINIIDCAEMYPVNPRLAETTGNAERVIGAWNAANAKLRGDYLLATKVSGEGFMSVRDGAPISSTTMAQAVEGSLRRLQTDYIDLYQLHWPNRGSYMFRQNWHYDPSKQDRQATLDHMADVLEGAQKLVDQGKIRWLGLSNESAWGTAKWLELAGDSLPRVASIQNEYSLMCRLFDTDLAELSHHEDVSLLAFSPLATGMLSGKYLDGSTPKGSRRSYVADLGGRMSPRSAPAVQAYVDLARDHGIDPIHMALAWCRTRPFMGSAIFGATTAEQLQVVLGSVELDLSPDLLTAIDDIHQAHPMPY